MNESLTIRAIKGGKAHAVETFAAFPATREIVADEFDEDAPPGGGDSHPLNPVVGSPDTDEAAGAIYPTVPAVKRASPEKAGIRENTARTFHATPGGNEDRGGAPENSRNRFDCLSVVDNMLPVCPFLRDDSAHARDRPMVFAKPAESSEARPA